MFLVAYFEFIMHNSAERAIKQCHTLIELEGNGEMELLLYSGHHGMFLMCFISFSLLLVIIALFYR
jgi:hypothetical protein